MPLICPPPPIRADVLNAGVARYVPDREPLACTAFLRWSDGCEEWITSVARRLDPETGEIFVQVDDPRCMFTGVWLQPHDVRFSQ